MTYAVYVDDQDIVWLTDFGANAIVRFDPRTEKFTAYPHGQANAAVRQLLGRHSEVGARCRVSTSWCSSASAEALDRGEHLSWLRDPLERVHAAILERDARARHQSRTVFDASVSSGPASEAMRAAVWTAMPRDRARCELDLAGVDTRAQLQPELLRVLLDGSRAADRARGPVESREKAVARGVHLDARVSHERSARKRVVAVEEIRHIPSPSEAARSVDPTSR